MAIPKKDLPALLLVVFIAVASPEEEKYCTPAIIKLKVAKPTVKIKAKSVKYLTKEAILTALLVLSLSVTMLLSDCPLSVMPGIVG